MNSYDEKYFMHRDTWYKRLTPEDEIIREQLEKEQAEFANNCNGIYLHEPIDLNKLGINTTKVYPTPDSSVKMNSNLAVYKLNQPDESLRLKSIRYKSKIFFDSYYSTNHVYFIVDEIKKKWVNGPFYYFNKTIRDDYILAYKPILPTPEDINKMIEYNKKNPNEYWRADNSGDIDSTMYHNYGYEGPIRNVCNIARDWFIFDKKLNILFRNKGILKENKKIKSLGDRKFAFIFSNLKRKVGVLNRNLEVSLPCKYNFVTFPIERNYIVINDKVKKINKDLTLSNKIEPVDLIHLFHRCDKYEGNYIMSLHNQLIKEAIINTMSKATKLILKLADKI